MAMELTSDFVLLGANEIGKTYITLAVMMLDLLIARETNPRAKAAMILNMLTDKSSPTTCDVALKPRM